MTTSTQDTVRTDRRCRWSIPMGEVAPAIERGNDVGLTVVVYDHRSKEVESFYWVRKGEGEGFFLLIKPSPENDGCETHEVDFGWRTPRCTCKAWKYSRTATCKHVEALRAALTAAGVRWQW